MNILTIPNLLTLSRIILTVFFFSAGLQGEWTWALWLYAGAAATDMIDGTLARLLNQKSQVGAFLDPMADKLMMLGGVTLLTLQDIMPWWLMALIIGRDLIIVFGVFYLPYRGIKIEYRPTILSKLTTLSQILTIVVGLIAAASLHGIRLPDWIMTSTNYYAWIIAATALLTFVTTIQYSSIGIRLLKGKNEGEKANGV